MNRSLVPDLSHQPILTPLARDKKRYLACCAGVFFGRPNVFAREHAMLKLQKRGGNGVSQREWEGGEEREEKTPPRKSCENEKHPLISRA